MPAAKAGIGPGMKLVAVNGRRFSPEILRDAVKATKNGNAPLDLLVENTDYYKTYKIDYHGGEKYPHLVRDESKPDLLSEILKAKVTCSAAVPGRMSVWTGHRRRLRGRSTLALAISDQARPWISRRSLCLHGDLSLQVPESTA